MSNTNPVTPVKTALWALLDNSAAFCALVPVGNRIKLSNAPKRGSQFADFPCVTIEPVTGLTVKDWTSSDCLVKKFFQVKIATGDTDSDKLDELEWVIFVALKDWAASMEALTWNGDTKYVKYAGVYEQKQTLDERELTKTETGWSTVWVGEVWMAFHHNDLVVGPA